MSDRVLDAVADDGSVVRITLPADAAAAGGVDAIDELRRRWPPRGLTLVAGPDDPVDDGGDDARTPVAQHVRLGTGEAAWDRLESDLGLFAVERVAGLVAVHAGVVLHAGRALLLPGRSHAGKTTLSLALRDAGAVLASDEYALVDPATGLVTGWPRPARIRVGVTDSRREPVAPAGDPVPVGMVALLRYDATLADEVDVIVPTRADAVVAVLDETVCARSRPDASLDAALALTAGRVVRGRRGEAAAAARWLLDRLADGP